MFSYRYFRDGKTYFIYFDEERPETILFYCDGIRRRLRVKQSFDFFLAGRKTFVLSAGGAKGLFISLSRAANEGFCACYLDMIIDDFNNSKSRRWIAA